MAKSKSTTRRPQATGGRARGAQTPTTPPTTPKAADENPTQEENSVSTEDQQRPGTAGTEKSNVNGPVEGNVDILNTGPNEGTTMATNEGVINEQGDKAGEGTTGEYDDANIPTGDLRTGVAGKEPVSPFTNEPRSASDEDASEDEEWNPEHKVAEPKGRILRNGEATTFSGEVVGNTVIVKEDVYREVYPFRSKRPTYVLVYAAGTGVPVTSLNALGVTVNDTSNNDEESEDNSGDDEE